MSKKELVMLIKLITQVYSSFWHGFTPTLSSALLCTPLMLPPSLTVSS